MWVSSRGGDGNITFGLTGSTSGTTVGFREGLVELNDATPGTEGWSMLKVALVAGAILVLAFVIAHFADIEVLTDVTEVGDAEEAIAKVRDVNFPLVMVAWILTTILFVVVMVKVPSWVEGQNGGK